MVNGREWVKGCINWSTRGRGTLSNKEGGGRREERGGRREEGGGRREEGGGRREEGGWREEGGGRREEGGGRREEGGRSKVKVGPSFQTCQQQLVSWYPLHYLQHVAGQGEVGTLGFCLKVPQQLSKLRVLLLRLLQSLQGLVEFADVLRVELRGFEGGRVRGGGGKSCHHEHTSL